MPLQLRVLASRVFSRGTVVLTYRVITPRNVTYSSHRQVAGVWTARATSRTACIFPSSTRGSWPSVTHTERQRRLERGGAGGAHPVCTELGHRRERESVPSIPDVERDLSHRKPAWMRANNHCPQRCACLQGKLRLPFSENITLNHIYMAAFCRLPNRWRQWYRTCLPRQETWDTGLIPGSGRSPGGGHGNALQHSCLENPRDREAWRGYSPWGRKESDMTEVT